MSLITCPECQQQVSDQAAACPNCGYPLNISSCNTSIPESIDQFDHISETTPQKKNNKKPVLIGCIALACAIIIGVIGFAVKSSLDKKAAAEARAEYIENLNEFTLMTLNGAAKAEGVCNLTKQVWYDTIYEEYNSNTAAYTQTKGKFHEDFNYSLQKLYASEEITASVTSIKENQAIVSELYKSLQNPTEEFQTCYDIVDDMYSAYYSLTNLALAPSGSLKTYSENLSDYDSDYIECYDKLNLLIPKE